MAINSTHADEKCDVIVIGGGPAGSTVATLLKEKGRSVILIDKDQHPRFHIGESLLPLNLPIFEQLGVLEQVHSIGVPKYGAEFNSSVHENKSQNFYFAESIGKDFPFAYQVKRDVFDHILIKNSEEKGVTVHQNTRVTEVDLSNKNKVMVEIKDSENNARTIEGKYVIDASGRSTFLSKKLGVKRKNPKHNSAALFAHFKNVELRDGNDAGNITVYWFDKGWFWLIPLQDGVVSIGYVSNPKYLGTRKSDPDTFLQETIKTCPDLADRMKNATQTIKAQATGNFSYTSSKMYGDNYVLIGDAYAFVDPVFSSGVYLAMHNAVLAANAVDVYLDNPSMGKKEMKKMEKTMNHGIKLFSWFIYRFTSPALRNLFMSPKNIFRTKEAVLSLLAGDIFRDTPIKVPMAIFKVIYWISFLFSFRQSWAMRNQRNMDLDLVFNGETAHKD